MWPFKNGKNQMTVNDYYHRERKTDELRRCANDLERGVLCERWATEARQKWFQGQAEVIGDIVYSTNDQYKFLDPRARELTAMMKWGKSNAAKDLAEADQMYSRWAHMYFAAWSAQNARQAS